MTTEVLTERQQEWLSDMDTLQAFLVRNPHLIPHANTVRIIDWSIGSADECRERVRALIEAAGPLMVEDATSKSPYLTVYARVGMHALGVNVPREALGRKVADAVPEVWEYDEGIVFSDPS